MRPSAGALTTPATFLTAYTATYSEPGRITDDFTFAPAATDAEYQRAGAQIAYSPEEVIGRAELLAKIGRPTSAELNWCAPGMALIAFYHMAVADRGLLDTLAERSLTAIGCEVIQQEDGSLPVLAAISEIAGQMTVPIAAHLLRSSSGGRGILLGGTPGVPPAHVIAQEAP